MSMKKIFLFLIVVLIFSFLFIAPVMAGDYGLTDVGTGAGYKNNDVYTIITLVVNVVLSLLAIIFFAIMMYGGIRWMTARGKDELTEKAKNAITAGIIGLIIIIISYSMSAFVLSKLGGGWGVNQKLFGLLTFYYFCYILPSLKNLDFIEAGQLRTCSWIAR